MSLPRITRPSAQAQAPQRIGVAMAVIMTGVLMTAVDTTIVVLALPEIQRGLHVALSAMVWVIISFLLVITLLATQVGRPGGSRRGDPAFRPESSGDLAFRPESKCRFTSPENVGGSR